MRTFLAEQYAVAVDLGPSAALAVVITVAQFTVLRHTAISLQVAAMLIVLALCGVSARRCQQRSKARRGGHGRN